MIPTNLIMKVLDAVYGTSQPGQEYHQVALLTADPAAVSPLGTIRDKDLRTHLCHIAPVGPIDVDQYVGQQLAALWIDVRQRGKEVMFVALVMEQVYVTAADVADRTADELARTLVAAGRLAEHPAASEVTRLYAACRDGRRWSGSHYLTGSRSGVRIGPDQCVSERPGPNEMGPNHELMRRMVGIG